MDLSNKDALDRDFCILWSKYILDNQIISNDSFLKQLGCLAEHAQINALQSFYLLSKYHSMYVDGNISNRHPNLHATYRQTLHNIEDSPENLYLEHLMNGSNSGYILQYANAATIQNSPFLAQRCLELAMVEQMLIPNRDLLVDIIKEGYSRSPDNVLNKFSYAKYLYFIKNTAMSKLTAKTLFTQIAALELSTELKDAVEPLTQKECSRKEPIVYSVSCKDMGL